LRIGTIQASLEQPSSGSFSNQALSKGDMEAVANWCEGADELGTLIWMAISLEVRQ
jgi:hypothetical protein